MAIPHRQSNMALPGHLQLDMTKNQATRHTLRSIQIGIVDAALTIAGLAALIGGVLALYRDSAPLAATGIAAGIALLFAATVSRFEFLKGFGVEAKVRRLDVTIDKAEQALNQLKELTLLTSKTTVKLFSMTGRLSGPPTIDYRAEIIANTGRLLHDVGATSEQIQNIREPLIKACVIDMMNGPRKLYEEAVSNAKKTINKRMTAITLEKAGEWWKEQADLSKRITAITHHHRTYQLNITITIIKHAADNELLRSRRTGIGSRRKTKTSPRRCAV